MDTGLVIQIVVNGICIGIIYALFALGLTVTFGVIHILNFAYGETYMMGAFLAYFFFTVVHLNYFVATILAMIGIALVGVLFYYLFFRHFRGQLLASYILSVGLLITLQTAGLILFGGKDKGVLPPIQGTLSFLGATISYYRLFLIPVCLGLVFGTYCFVRYNKWGRAMSCVQQDEEAAKLQGMSPAAASYLAMALAGALAGACGALAAPLISLNSMMGLTPLLRALVVMSIAGVGSIPGVLVVGLSLGLVESIISTFDATLSNIVTFAALVVMLVVKPTGFWGRQL